MALTKALTRRYCPFFSEYRARLARGCGVSRIETERKDIIIFRVQPWKSTLCFRSKYRRNFQLRRSLFMHLRKWFSSYAISDFWASLDMVEHWLKNHFPVDVSENCGRLNIFGSHVSGHGIRISWCCRDSRFLRISSSSLDINLVS